MKLFAGKNRDGDRADKAAAPVHTADARGRRQLIASSFMTLLSVFVLIAATMAWFASNRDVDSGGMQMDIDTNPNLIIVKGSENIAAATASSNAVTFTDAAKTLTPATHDWADAISNAGAVATSTGLKYNSNPSVISPTTGEKLSAGSTVYFNAVPVYVSGAEKEYYVDYTVKLASTDKTMSATRLYATMSSDDTDSHDYQNAASVDFYLDSVAEANYKGTLNLAGKSYTNSGSAVTEVDLMTGSAQTPITIPLNTSGSITVVMRFYFDGGLEKTSGQAYVYSEGLSTDDFTMKVHFAAEE